MQLYAFDPLAIDGDDLRDLPLYLLKNQLSRLLARRVGGVQLAPFEQGEIGPDLFRAACRMGLEGLVSKRRDRPYRARRSPHWLKVKIRHRQRCNARKMDRGDGSQLPLSPRKRTKLGHSLMAALAAGSTDRCNTFCELLSWRLIEQGLSRPFIEPPSDGAELSLAVQGQIRSARKILSQQPIGIFV